MSVSPAQAFPPPPEAQTGQGKVRAQEETFPPSGKGSSGEPSAAQRAAKPAPEPQDEVKLQWNPSDPIPVYQFINQQGSLILQVPSEQELNLAREIAQELSQETAPRTTDAVEGSKGNGG
jgi:hypothetical protein